MNWPPKPIEATEITVATDDSSGPPKARRSSVMRMIQSLETGVALQPPVREPKPVIRLGPIKLGRTLRVAGKAIADVVKPAEPPPTPSRINKKKAADLLTTFLRGGELEISTHIGRMDEIIESLEWTVTHQGESHTLKFGKADGQVTAADIHRKISRSMEVFMHLYAERDSLAFSQLTLLKTLQARGKRYRPLKKYARETMIINEDSLTDLKAITVADAPPPLKVTVLGGGPVGLRTALEMALLGHKVTVLEARNVCSRLNVLKLWEETTVDLDRIGLKQIDPDYSNKKSGRASTGRLQLSLLKACLLMGVEIKVDREYLQFDLTKLESECDVLLIATGFSHALYDRLRAQAAVLRFEDHGLVGAGADEEGTRHIPEGYESSGDSFEPKEEGKAPAAAIAVVCHFARDGDDEQVKAWRRSYEPFDWTVQDARGADDPTRLAAMQKRYGRYCIAPKRLEEEGIALENIITYTNKGHEPFDSLPPSYYYIFTLRSEMVTNCRDDEGKVKWPLIKMGPGAPTEGGSRALLQWAKSKEAKEAGVGLDRDCLDKFIKRVVTLFTEGYVQDTQFPVSVPLPEACPLLKDKHPGKEFQSSVDIFDFSERNCMSRACEVVTAIDGVRRKEPLLVLSVGDALQEPFWPEGLGINRGMHNALDACWAANKWGEARGKGSMKIATLVQQREALYNGKTLQMHGKNRQMLLGYNRDNSKGTSPKPAKEYTPDPATRYHAPLFSARVQP